MLNRFAKVAVRNAAVRLQHPTY
jgi:protein SCO1